MAEAFSLEVPLRVGKAAGADKLTDGKTDRVLVGLFHGGGWNQCVVNGAVPDAHGSPLWIMFGLLHPNEQVAVSHEARAENPGGSGEARGLFHLGNGLVHRFPRFELFSAFTGGLGVIRGDVFHGKRRVDGE